MGTVRIRLGELLVQANLIKQEQLEEMLKLQKEDGRRLGTLLVEKGLVSEFNVTQILGQQLSVPWVALQHIDFSSELLEMVPVEMAERYCVIPIYVRRVRGLGSVLYVAMDDPTNQTAVDEVSKQSGLPVRTMIAPPSHIRGALWEFYGVGEEPEESVLEPMSPAAALPPLNLTPQAPAVNVSKPPSLHGAAPVSAADVARLRLQWNEFLTRVTPGAPSLAVKLHSGKVLKLALASADGQFAELPITHELTQAFTAAHDDDVKRTLDWQTILGNLIAALIQAGVVIDLSVAKPEPPKS